MKTFSESRALAEAAKPGSGTGVLDVVFITEGWGSSGYYSGAMLEEAGKNNVFPAGTQMFINHPTATENEERPVRDLGHLAAVLAEDATWDPEVKGLRGSVKTFSNWREPLAEMAPHIGVSIRAAGEVEEGEAPDGKTGPIITSLTEGLSIDFVTRAGRGGHIAEVLESALANGVKGAADAPKKPVEEALSSNVSENLRTALRKAHNDKNTWAYLRDFDEAAKYVYFESEGEDGGQTYRQKFTNSEGLIALEGEPEAVRVVTTYVPIAAPSGQSITPEESQEDTMPTIEESRLSALLEAEASVATLTQERDRFKADAEEARREARTASNLTVATATVKEAFEAQNVEAPKTQARLAAAAPLNESGDVDVEALKQIASESAAEIAESKGHDGSVRGLGGTSTSDGEDISEDEYNKRLAALSGRILKEA